MGYDPDTSHPVPFRFPISSRYRVFILLDSFYSLEAAVRLFLNDKISFLDIESIMKKKEEYINHNFSDLFPNDKRNILLL